MSNLKTQKQNQCDVPKFSVIIPNKNRTNSLYRAVSSVLKQTYKSFEIIIVDDSQPKIYDKIYKKYANNMNKIKLIRGSKTGDSEAREIGIKKATGKYIAFLDSDNEFLPRKLDKHLYVWEKTENIGMSWDIQLIVKGRKVWKCDNPVFMEDRKHLVKTLLFTNPITMSTGVVDRKLLLDIIKKPIKGPFDHILWLRLATKFKCIYIPEILTKVYVDGEDRLSSNRRRRINEFFRVLPEQIKVLKWYIKRYRDYNIVPMWIFIKFDELFSRLSPNLMRIIHAPMRIIISKSKIAENTGISLFLEKKRV